MQLSDELTSQAGQDLVRYTREGGRVTLPVAVRGSLVEPAVSIDLVSATRRAVTNAASEAIGRALGDALDPARSR